jgi:hypothetical protein
VSILGWRMAFILYRMFCFLFLYVTILCIHFGYINWLSICEGISFRVFW